MAKNLMGLLLVAPEVRLRQIARCWGIEERAGQEAFVSQLYREMTDPLAVREVLEPLAPDERLVLDMLLEETRGWLIVEELAHFLPFTTRRVEEMLRGLEEPALVVMELPQGREGETQGHLLPGEAFPAPRSPIAYIPSDLAQVMKNVRREMAAGDRSQKGLHNLLADLELTHLYSLAERWGIPYAYQHFKRELMTTLEKTLAQPKEVGKGLAALGEGAQSLYALLLTAGGKLELHLACEELGLSERALRPIVRDLRDLFIVHETYVDGRRALFIPKGVAQTDSHQPLPHEQRWPLTEVDPPHAQDEAGIAFFQNLLILLNYLQENEVTLTSREHRLPRRIASQIDQRLTLKPCGPRADLRPAAGRPSACQDYLWHCARRLGLFQVSGRRLLLSEKVGDWVHLGWAGQARAVYHLWLTDDEWREPLASAGHEAEMEHLPPARRELSRLLREARVGKWYSFGSLLRKVKNSNSQLLRPNIKAIRYRGYRRLATAVRDWYAVEGQVIAAMMAIPLYWVGAVSVGYDTSGNLVAFQLTPLGGWLLGSNNGAMPTRARRRMVVQPDCQIILGDPEAETFYRLLQFTVRGPGCPSAQADPSAHCITREAVQRAVRRGQSAAEILDFLSAAAKGEVPPSVVSAVTQWAG